MGKIIKISQSWTDEDVDKLLDELRYQHDGDAIVVRDDNMEVFEYDDLENVTVHAEEVREEMNLEREIDTEAYFKVE